MQDLSCGESSSTDQITTPDVPNGLTAIKESNSGKSLDKPQSPGSSGTNIGHSKFKTPRPLGATKNNPRRMSDSVVAKKPSAAKSRPTSSVSGSKIQSKSPHSKKPT